MTYRITYSDEAQAGGAHPDRDWVTEISEDQGKSWTNLAKYVPTGVTDFHTDAHSMLIDSSGRVYVGGLLQDPETGDFISAIFNWIN